MGRIHRCLTEGKLGGEDGNCPLNAVVWGGLAMHDGEDYVVSYNTPAEVREVAAALGDLDIERFSRVYWSLDLKTTAPSVVSRILSP